MSRSLVQSTGLAAILSLSACSQMQPPPITPDETAKTPVVDPDVVDYPKGPYGYNVGSVIENLQFVGQSDSNNNGMIDTGDTIKTVRFSDFYADKSLKVLFVGVAAGWCSPCKMEQPALVELYGKYGGAKGNVGFMEAIIQGPSETNPVPADMPFVDTWAGDYKIPFTMATDAAVVLGPYYAADEFPMQLVIRTSDMTIQYQGNGTGAVSDVVTEFSNIFDTIISG